MIAVEKNIIKNKEPFVKANIVENSTDAPTFAKISLWRLQKSVHSILWNIDPLLVTYELQSWPGALVIEWLESELCTPGGQRFNDPADIVADNAEPGDLGVLLHGPSQRVLRILCHRICLVQNDDLVRRAWVAAGHQREREKEREVGIKGKTWKSRRRGERPDDFKRHRGLGKGLHFLADNLNSTLVGGIELEHSVAPQLRSGKYKRRRKKKKKIRNSRNTNLSRRHEAFLYPKSSRQSARIVEVLPVPGGP